MKLVIGRRTNKILFDPSSNCRANGLVVGQEVGISKMGVSRGCLVNWSLINLDWPGSATFHAVVNGACPDSCIDGLGVYTATCLEQDGEGDWFQLYRSTCTNEICSDCTRIPESRVGSWPLASNHKGQSHCNVNAFYKEKFGA